MKAQLHSAFYALLLSLTEPRQHLGDCRVYLCFCGVVVGGWGFERVLRTRIDAEMPRLMSTVDGECSLHNKKFTMAIDKFSSPMLYTEGKT